MPIDTLKVAKRLQAAGFSDPQAEAVVAAVQEAEASSDLVRKGDLDAARNELKTEIADLRAELAGLRTELKADIREAELRLEAKIEAVKADILNRVFAMILGTLVVNIVAIAGAMFAVAKLVGH
jgi:ribosomal protein L29